MSQEAILIKIGITDFKQNNIIIIESIEEQKMSENNLL